MRRLIASGAKEIIGSGQARVNTIFRKIESFLWHVFLAGKGRLSSLFNILRHLAHRFCNFRSLESHWLIRYNLNTIQFSKSAPRDCLHLLLLVQLVRGKELFYSTFSDASTLPSKNFKIFREALSESSLFIEQWFQESATGGDTAKID